MSWIITGTEKYETDPYRSQVSLLLHGDGANGSQTISDSSPSPKTVTAVGDTQINTTLTDPFGRTGVGVIAFDGNGDWLQTQDPVGLGGANFTIEFWGYNITQTGNWGLFSIGATIGSDWAGITMSSAGDLFLSTTGTSWTYSSVGSITLSTNDNQWHHYAIARNGGLLLTFKDGVQQGTVSISGSLANNAGYILFGRKSDSALTASGYIDELRITKGVARYTSNFTPPTAPFPDI